MKRKVLLFALILGTLPAITASPFTYAASDNECAIWLCLPSGFPSGCGDARRAFKKRIKKFKSPLPSFSSCLYQGVTPSAMMSARDGIAAYIPQRKICNKWEKIRRGGEWDSYCLSYSIIPARAVKNTPCIIHDGKEEETYRTPKYCTHTIRYVDTFMDGKKYGDTHYFSNGGDEISIPRR
ncbi:hypothetical protein [Vibrio rotiferianus]|uniref:hypothetical protein n=1 Tax=Vibrio rotiferianus TaxID=190895 RepID=UPI0005ED8715|nr:hypothetical protein [Vibrio rotiferianus]